MELIKFLASMGFVCAVVLTSPSALEEAVFFIRVSTAPLGCFGHRFAEPPRTKVGNSNL
jgi:hypothetical protein